MNKILIIFLFSLYIEFSNAITQETEGNKNILLSLYIIIFLFSLLVRVSLTFRFFIILIILIAACYL